MNWNLNKNSKLDIKNSAGLSLLEAVIYVSLLAIIFVVVVNSAIVLSGAFAESRVRRNVAAGGSAALDRVLYEARLANDIDEAASVFGAHPGALALRTVKSASDDTPATKTISVDQSGALVLSDGTATTTMTAGINVTRMMFYALSTADSVSEAVTVRMSVRDEFGTAAAEQDFSGTAVLRGSY